jgi:hypothetical protein
VSRASIAGVTRGQADTTSACLKPSGSADIACVFATSRTENDGNGEESDGPSPGAQSQRVGQAFEGTMLRVMLKQKNTEPFPSQKRRDLYGVSDVIPDAVAPFVRLFPPNVFSNSNFIEFKAVRPASSLSLAYESGQLTGMIDVLAHSPAAQAGEIPTLVIVKTSDTVIHHGVPIEGTVEQVAVSEQGVVEVANLLRLDRSLFRILNPEVYAPTFTLVPWHSFWSVPTPLRPWQ